MYTNSDQSNFLISLPQDWLYDEIQEKYLTYIKRLPQPFDTVTDFLNSTIQSCTFPGFEFQTIERSTRDTRTIDKGGFDASSYSNRTLTINFKTVSGFANYFILLDQIILFYSFSNGDRFLPPVRLTILDEYGHNAATFLISKIVPSAISDLELSYSSDVPEFRTFSIEMKFSEIEYFSDFSPNKIKSTGGYSLKPY
jgi:hypothetical protein